MQLHPENTERPWGMFRLFTQNTPATIKIISVKKGGVLSLQYHNHREEFWHIVSGTPIVEIGDTKTTAHKGDEFTIQRKQTHRISAPTDDVEFLEISLGEFDEGDIFRISDAYGRA
ncbi:MAG: phosphomannose isomerase type II C-terminal cupin domain [bacterium]